jgi:hypothetical protein
MSHSDNPKGSQARFPRPIFEARWFTDDYLAPDWIIDGVLQRGRLYACTSLTSHGKTAVWLYNACMIANGSPVGTHRTWKSDVLIMQGENPDDLKGRLLAMQQTTTLDWLPYVMPGHFALALDEIDRIHHQCEHLALKLGLVIVDTAASFFPFDEENSNVQNGNYARGCLRPLTKLPGDPAVVVLCHPVKGATKDNLVPRGGGAFLNELDGNFTLWSEPPLRQTTELHWQDKIRGPDFTPINYRLKSVAVDGYHDNFGNPPFSVVASPISEDAVASFAASNLINQNHVLKTIHENPNFSFADIARALGWVGLDGEPIRHKVQRIVEQAADDKCVQQPRKGARYHLTEKGKKLVYG